MGLGVKVKVRVRVRVRGPYSAARVASAGR